MMMTVLRAHMHIRVSAHRQMWNTTVTSQLKTHDTHTHTHTHTHTKWGISHSLGSGSVLSIRHTHAHTHARTHTHTEISSRDECGSASDGADLDGRVAAARFVVSRYMCVFMCCVCAILFSVGIQSQMCVCYFIFSGNSIPKRTFPHFSLLHIKRYHTAPIPLSLTNSLTCVCRMCVCVCV